MSIEKQSTDRVQGYCAMWHGWWQACPEIGAAGYDPLMLTEQMSAFLLEMQQSSQ